MQVVIQKIPENLQEFETLAAKGRQPEHICALFLCALALFDRDKDAGTAAMDLLRGPKPMSPYDCQFLRDRLRGKAYLPLAYFEGAAPENGYQPRMPYTLNVLSDPRPQDIEPGYMRGGRGFAAAYEAAAEGIYRPVVPMGILQHSQRHPYPCGGRPMGITIVRKEIDTYMGLFDKKYCDICGEKIGLFGNRKLENGNLCKNCAKKLSPWFSDRRSSTVEEIKAQLAYREENQGKVAAFHTTRTLGTDTKVLLDEDAGKFMVTRARNLAEANPDVLDFADVTGCNLDIDESRSELMREDKDGKEVSYNPPRYEYSYDFYITIFVNNPYFDEMRFRLNASSVDITPPPALRPGMAGGYNPETNVEYRSCKRLGEEIRQALTQVRRDVREKIEQAAAPKTAVTCPYCGATTTPDASGCCEYCGSAIGG